MADSFAYRRKEDVNLIWRFYQDENRKWRWQQMIAGQEVVNHSPSAHLDYGRCLADARKRGYVFEMSQPGHGPRK